MRRNKALLPHPDGSGRTLLRAAAETLLAAGLSPGFVVLGHERRRLARELEGLGKTLRTVPNPAYRSGMLSSLQAGIRALASEGHVRWALVAPLDQPFVSTGLIGRLLAARSDSAAAILPATAGMAASGTWGLPALLSRRLFPELLSLTREPGEPDRGAKPLLARRPGELRFVPAEEQELLDLDDEKAYDSARGAEP